ncbi:MAG TPA: cation diffusion facilitator family transporter [Anaerolineae bacterium]|nr:cation diffusion facilitator family transporter [Anaerolineae bacterium]
MEVEDRAQLPRYAWLSIGAALATMALKLTAYWITNSVGLLSDAAESSINLIGALLALAVLIIAARPPDEEHAYGHGKAEYFSSGVEGTLIFLAALLIGYEAIARLLNPQPIETPIIGLIVAALASLINLGVSLVLIRKGKENNSITLEADGRHLMTDVWTSGGVILGVAAVALTGWYWLDPLIALAVAINIVWTGFKLVRRSVLGLMDTALPEEDLQKINGIQDIYKKYGVQFHALRSRQAASRRFVSMHVLVPGDWTVQHGHQLLEKIEADIRRALPNITVFTHLESLNDPASWDDTTLDRKKQTEKVETPPG